MKEVTLRQIAQACGGTLHGDERDFDTAVSGIVTDSRIVERGYLYIPIIGQNNNGHDYISQAFEKGALCSLTQEKTDAGKTYIKVQSTFDALKDIAEFYRSLFDVKVIAITGSVGKTTTKEFIYSVLSQKYNVLKSEKNFNNEIGVPLTLFKLEDYYDFAIIEMGMNHFGEISRLSKAARPDVCIIVNADYTHVGHLGSREAIFKAKCEIFDYAKENSMTFLNGDDDLLYTIKDKNAVFYGMDEHNDFIAYDIRENELKNINFKIKRNQSGFKIKLKYPGRHLIYAVLAATAVGSRFGLSKAQIKRGIKSFTPADNRTNIINTGKITIINDVYNASPASVRAAIDLLKNADGRKICILGDMLELGDHAEKLHNQAGIYAAENKIDITICAGELAEDIYNGAKQTGSHALWFSKQEELIENLDSIIKKGDTILVKASRGMKFEKTVEELKKIKL